MGSVASSGSVSVRASGEGLSTNLEALVGGKSGDTIRALELFSTFLANQGISLEEIARGLNEYVSLNLPSDGELAFSAAEYNHLVFDAVTFLTSAICEGTDNMGPKDLSARGLGYDELEGEFYPLTEDEQRFIGDSDLELFGHLALTGYSVVIGNRKYVAPAIEIDYGPEQGLHDFGQASRVNTDLAHKVASMAQRLGGMFYASSSPDVEFSDGAGKFLIHLFVPMETAGKLASDFSGWLAVLRFAAQTDTDFSDYLEKAG